MTDEEMNIAISKYCKWEQTIERYVQNLPLYTQMPNYVGDHNAMYDAINTLTYDELENMVKVIDPTHDGVSTMTANAWMKAYAFLTVKGHSL